MDRKVTLVLASGSPRRRDLLRGVTEDFRVIPSSVDETPLDGETVEDMVLRLSLAKARDVFVREPLSWVIGADTAVEVDGRILGKPRDRSEAFEMITALQGREHRVLTGVSVVSPHGEESRVERTLVRFRPLTEEEAWAYVDTGEGDDKAGAYAIQGKGSLLVESIEGCYFNVVGLPMVCLSRMLHNLGFPLYLQLGVKAHE
ncbi:Maf family protein [Thermanaerovibrio acidaminovorans]|uniref:dTTP/UTP pyrophosphatase n=1 Tax=Thermanaerovibrio acidaminovorans (strain ATCC 49978 / DSM 6589 / Su883) TaxID=525903 RepID=D1B8W5_THEAS|nr:Maf family protein [Thermanaerovibrio acidaminovorans]ACZ18718.1 maf protein [Thermanaerovibrio acidaminovorans DSM 6589]